jgi:hypothetical protein
VRPEELARRAHPEGAMRVNLAVVPEPFASAWRCRSVVIRRSRSSIGQPGRMRAGSSASPALWYGGRCQRRRRAAPPPRGSSQPLPACRPPPSSGTVRIGRRPGNSGFLPARWTAPPSGSRLRGSSRPADACARGWLLEAAHPGGPDHLVADPHRLAVALDIRRLQLNSRLGERPCLRARKRPRCRSNRVVVGRTIAVWGRVAGCT